MWSYWGQFYDYLDHPFGLTTCHENALNLRYGLVGLFKDIYDGSLIMLPIDSSFWLTSCYRLLFLFCHYSLVILSFVSRLVTHLFTVLACCQLFVSHLWFYWYRIFPQFPYCDGSHNSHNNTSGDNVGPLIIKKKEWRVTTFYKLAAELWCYFSVYTLGQWCSWPSDGTADMMWHYLKYSHSIMDSHF